MGFIPTFVFGLRPSTIDSMSEGSLSQVWGMPAIAPTAQNRLRAARREVGQLRRLLKNASGPTNVVRITPDSRHSSAALASHGGLVCAPRDCAPTRLPNSAPRANLRLATTARPSRSRAGAVETLGKLIDESQRLHCGRDPLLFDFSPLASDRICESPQGQRIAL